MRTYRYGPVNWDDTNTSAKPRRRPNPEYVTGLETGLRCLAMFHKEKRPLTISEIANDLDLSRAAVRRSLLTLLHMRYLAQSGRQFTLAPQTAEIGATFDEQVGLAAWLRPYCERLQEATQETVSVTFLREMNAVYALRFKPNRPFNLAIHKGDHLPAHLVSGGRVLLAAQPEHVIRQYLQMMPLTARTPSTLTDPEAIWAELRRVAETDCAIVVGELDESIAGVAKPVRDSLGRVVGAMSVGVSLARFSPKQLSQQILPLLEQTIRDIATDQPGGV